MSRALFSLALTLLSPSLSLYFLSLSRSLFMSLHVSRYDRVALLVCIFRVVHKFRDAPFVRLGFTPPPSLTTSSRSLFLEFRHVTLFFTAVRLLSVYFGLASRSMFAVRDCVTLESFFSIYERSLINCLKFTQEA